MLSQGWMWIPLRQISSNHHIYSYPLPPFNYRGKILLRNTLSQFSNQKVHKEGFNYGEQKDSHKHTTIPKSVSIQVSATEWLNWLQDCLLAKRVKKKANENLTKIQKRNLKLYSYFSPSTKYMLWILSTSASRDFWYIIQCFNSWQITSKFPYSCSFMGHFYLVIFFHVTCKQEENIQHNVPFRNKLMAQFGVNFTAQWSESDLAGCPHIPRRSSTESPALMLLVSCLQAR